MSASRVTRSATSIASPASIKCGSGRRSTCPRRRWRSTRTPWAISPRSPEAGAAMALIIRAVGCLVLVGLLAVPESGRAQDAPRRGGEIRVATYGDPGTLDPHITTDVPALRIRNQICETLITWDAQTKEAPMLADSWENSADGTVWTFKLRRGVKFHGGQTMRAADVKYSFERILKVSPRKTDYQMIKEIKTPDDHTVQFVLSARTSAFFPALAMYWAQVVEAASTEKQVKETGGVTTPNCTGPFKVSEYRRGQWLSPVRQGPSPPPGDTPGAGGGRGGPSAPPIPSPSPPAPTGRFFCCR